VALPLVWPTSGTVALLVAVWYWSDFVHPLLYLRSETLRPVAVGLRTLQQLDPTGWPILMAGALLMIVPVVLLYLVAQRTVLYTERMSWDD
jgi:ABC-type glycerol-3-phosphate transport system permease component